MPNTRQQQGIFVHGEPVTDWPVHGGIIPTHGGIIPTHGSPNNNPYADYPLALDFKNGLYQGSGELKYDITQLAGYAYARAGNKAELGVGNIIVPFAANVPGIIQNLGYYSRAAFINSALRSSAVAAQMGLAGNLIDTTPPAGAPSTHPNWVLLDNSTTSAYAYTANNPNLLPSTVYTFSFLCETPDGSQPVYGATASDDFYVLFGASTVSGISVTYQRIIGTNIWRVAVTGTSAGSLVAAPYAGLFRPSTVSKRAIKFSVGQTVLGAQPGPIIVTTGAAASVAADDLEVAVPNGSYNATYLFDDGSEQVIPTDIIDGTFTMPTYPTLNRTVVSRVILEEPAGIVPYVSADFKSGAYSIDGASTAVGTLFHQELDWGAFSVAEDIEPGVGLDGGGTAASPALDNTIAADMIANGFICVLDIVAGATGAGYVLAVDLPGYAEEIHAELNGGTGAVTLSDYGGSVDDAGWVFSTGAHRVAALISPTELALSIDGRANITKVPNSFDVNRVIIALNGGTTVIEKVVFYRLTDYDAADLPTLSTL